MPPYLPLLFMGQEYGETAPFLYFTSHGDPGLAEAVTRGRREEMSAFLDVEAFADPQHRKPSAARGWTGACSIGSRTRRCCAGTARCSRSAARTPASPMAGWISRAHFHEALRWLALECGDPGGEATWLFAKFSPEGQAIAVPRPRDPGRLAPWSGEARFGGTEQGDAPPAALDAVGAVQLSGWACALYLRSEGR